MRRLFLCAPFAGALAILAGACSSSNNPAQPSSSSGSSASVTAPRAISPANNSVVRNADQPISLTVQNAVVTNGASGTYTFEVAVDSGFVNKVQTRDAVPQGSGGQTAAKLDVLPASRDYFWHARASGGGTTGLFGPVMKFSIGPAITLNAPAPVSPASGSPTTGRPSLLVANAPRQGPAGPITYKFDIASDPGFQSIVTSGIVAEQPAQTAFAPGIDLAANNTFYWRATAMDAANGVTSAPSVVWSFVTSLAIDLSTVIVSYRDAPTDIAQWRQTATIQSVEQDGSAASGGLMCIRFTMSEFWPAIPFFGDASVPVYANQWYFAHIGNQWYGGPGEYLRADRASTCKTGQGTTTIGHDGGWTGPMASWIPKVGEMVGYMVSTPARNYSAHHTVNQRSNIVVQPWRDTSLGSATAGRRP